MIHRSILLHTFPKTITHSCLHILIVILLCFIVCTCMFCHLWFTTNQSNSNVFTACKMLIQYHAMVHNWWIKYRILSFHNKFDATTLCHSFQLKFASKSKFIYCLNSLRLNGGLVFSSTSFSWSISLWKLRAAPYTLTYLKLNVHIFCIVKAI